MRVFYLTANDVGDFRSAMSIHCIEVARALAQKIRETVGFEGRIVWDTSKPDGQPRRMLDTTRAWQSFGFRAETDLDDGLRRTIEWYEDHRDDGECPERTV